MEVEGIICAPVATRAAAFFVTPGVAAVFADELLAPAVFTAVANAVSVARTIAGYAINLDAVRLRPTMKVPLG